MRILVYGAGVQGCELAHRLLQNKKNVVTMLALRPVADDEAPLVEPLLPLAPRQQSHRVFLVLCQPVGQLTALHACTVH